MADISLSTSSFMIAPHSLLLSMPMVALHRLTSTRPYAMQSLSLVVRLMYTCLLTPTTCHRPLTITATRMAFNILPLTLLLATLLYSLFYNLSVACQMPSGHYIPGVKSSLTFDARMTKSSPSPESIVTT
jgi:hypothetical protein